MTASTNDAEVEQVLSAIRNLIVQSRSPEKPAPLLLTPEFRIAEPVRVPGSAPIKAEEAPASGGPGVDETPDDGLRGEALAPLFLMSASDDRLSDDGAHDDDGQSPSEEPAMRPDAPETSPGSAPVPAQPASGPQAELPDLAGYLALVGVPPGLGPVPTVRSEEPSPLVAPADAAAAPDGSDALAEEPTAWVEPAWPELAPVEAPEADPAALPGSALGALLAEEAPDLPPATDLPEQPAADLRDQVATLVREALEGEMDRLRALVREEVRLTLQNANRP